MGPNPGQGEIAQSRNRAINPVQMHISQGHHKGQVEEGKSSSTCPLAQVRMKKLQLGFATVPVGQGMIAYEGDIHLDLQALGFF